MAEGSPRLLYRGRHLELVARGGWEFARRPTASGVVGVAAVTVERNLVLVSQHRPPAGGPVLELPAGLVGDEAGQEDEALLDAARRELLEETGFVAPHWRPLADGPSSAGLTDEHVTLFAAEGCTRQGPGGGVGSEAITVHEVPLASLAGWLTDWRAEGFAVDHKILAAAWLLGIPSP